MTGSFPGDLLGDLLRVQDQIRALDQEIAAERAAQLAANTHQGFDADGNAVGTSGRYKSAGMDAMPKGTVLATSGQKSNGQEPWADTAKRSSANERAQYQCANGTNCLDDNFCYHRDECDECQECFDNQCIDRSPDTPCQQDTDCPCPPNDDQEWICIQGGSADGGQCKLTCREFADCQSISTCPDEPYACDLGNGYCGPGCVTDSDCGGRAADSKPNALCIDCECRTPCEPPEWCREHGDCGEGQFCAEWTGGRTKADTGATGYACTDGCADDSHCEGLEEDLVDDLGETYSCDDTSSPPIRCPSGSFCGEQGRCREIRPQSCVENRCELVCNSDDDCFSGDECNQNRCQPIPRACIGNSDCLEGTICTGKGICESGCRTDEECEEKALCPREEQCVAECPYDQSCECTEGCDGDDWEWISRCPKDPACVAKCPIKEGCTPKPDNSQRCVFGRCETGCTSKGDCSTDGGKGYACKPWGEIPGNQCEEDEDEDDQRPGPCDNRSTRSDGCIGYSGSVCVAASKEAPDKIDDRLGCEDDECCAPDGTCAPCACTVSAECRSGLVCDPQKGICVPGCDDENPCQNDCCGTDGLCHTSCSSDSNCNAPETCLDSGCCGMACEPLVKCVSKADCEENQYCDGGGICQDGCNEDSDCLPPADEPSDRTAKCWQFSCAESCSSSQDCNTEGLCISDEDCAPDTPCISGECVPPQESWEQACDGNGLCYSVDIDCCSTHADCPAKEVLDDEGEPTGELNYYYCDDGRCASGCWQGSQCKNSDCIDNQCKRECRADSECKVLGQKWACQYEDGARQQAVRQYKLCMKDYNDKKDSGNYKPETLQSLYQQCQEIKPNDDDFFGYCQEVNPLEPSPSEGCECFEECNETGACAALPCETDQDCPCESCLASGLCGLCYQDEDCSNSKTCDRPQVCEGDNCQDDPEQGGTCIESCVPKEKCEGNADCPPGSICKKGACVIGCRDSQECLPGETCDDRTGRCEVACAGDQQCNTDIEICGPNGWCQYVGWSCINDGDCPPDQGYCRAGKCEADTRCANDLECEGGTSGSKCVGGFCSNVESDDPYKPVPGDLLNVTGCESCADCCTEKFTCDRCPCTEDAECPCGVCAPDGKCLEDCKSNADCINGVCKEGKCVECIRDTDCFGHPSGKEGLLCSPSNSCETPCGVALSSGDCFSGLNLGDTCQNCSDRCPDGVPCKELEQRTCGFSEVWDPTLKPNGGYKLIPIPCVVCFKACNSTSECPDDHVCNGGEGDIEPYCERHDGKCSFDSDCPNNLPMCIRGVCRETGDECIGASDCEPLYDDNAELIPQVCYLGTCIEGTCDPEEYPCPGGQTCVDGECFPSCNIPYIACGKQFEQDENGDDVLGSETEVPCPTGYVCDVDRCISNDYLGLDTTMGCSGGKFCDRGGCVPINYGIYECATDEDCMETVISSIYAQCRAKYGPNNPRGLNDCIEGKRQDQFSYCDANLCRNPDGSPKSGAPNDGPGSTSNDPCEKSGKCCGLDGFCGSCKCDEEHPCTEKDHLCEAESGFCFHHSEHPNTKYGTPGGCKFDEIFTILYDPDGNEVRPEEDFNDPTVPGCNYEQECVWNSSLGVEECEDVLRCWDGFPLGPAQVREELDKICDTGKDCDCSDFEQPPEQSECFYDTQCGKCQRCIGKYFAGTECCPLASELIDGEGVSSEIDGVYRNVCEVVYEEGDRNYDNSCKCLADDDCTECEYCELSDTPTGGQNNLLGDETFGRCVKDCELCPTGGETSKGDKCPGCRDRFGACAIEVETVLSAESVGSDGRMIPAETAGACVVDRTNACCETYVDVFDIKNSKNRAPKNSGCRVIKVSDGRGGQLSVQTDICLDWKEGICAQCRVDADCSGSQQCLEGLCVTQCGLENSANVGDVGLRGEAFGWAAQDCSCCTDDGTCRELYESWTENDNGFCRPCACGSNGIDCGPALECESCWKWQRVDRSEGTEDPVLDTAKDHGRMLELENALLAEQVKEVEANIEKEDWQESANYWEAQVSYWQGEIDNCEVICERDGLDNLVFPQKCTPQVQQECQRAASKLSETQAGLNESNLQVQAWQAKIMAAQEAQVDIVNKLNGDPFNPGAWEQVKQCECCIDDQCRDPEECSYGNCYLCIEENIPEYGFAIYSKVLELPILCGFSDFYGKCGCAECPSEENDCSRAPSPSCRQPYVNKLGAECIRYDCADGLFLEEREPVGTNDRYYEYCTGSIITCAMNRGTRGGSEIGKQYMNGFKFTVDYGPSFYYESGGGSFGVNRHGEILIAAPKDKFYELQCMFPNRMGHIRGHYLPTFVDQIATSQLCSKGVVFLNCDPEQEPNCGFKFRQYFEKGATSELVKRLKAEVEAIMYQIAQASVYLWQIQWKIEDLEKEIEELEEKHDELVDDYNDMKADLIYYMEEKERLEKDIEETIEKFDADCSTEDVTVFTETCEVFDTKCQDECIFESRCDLVWDSGLEQYIETCEPIEFCVEKCEDIERCLQESNIENQVDLFDSENGMYCTRDEYWAIFEEKEQLQIDAIAIRDEAQTQLTLEEDRLDVFETNQENAKNAVSRKEKEIVKLQIQFNELFVEYKQLECDDPPESQLPGDVTRCVELDAEMFGPGGLEERITIAQDELNDYRSQMDGWHDAALDQQEVVRQATKDLDDAQRDVDEATQDASDAFTDWLVYDGKVQEEEQALVEMQNDLSEANAEIERLNEQIGELEGQIQICVDVPCLGPEGAPIAGCKNEECQDGTIQDLIADKKSMIEDWEALDEELCSPGPGPPITCDGEDGRSGQCTIQTDGGNCQKPSSVAEWQEQIEAKQEQIARLEEDLDQVKEPTASSRPGEGKTEKQLSDAYKAALEEAKKRKENDWYPS